MTFLLERLRNELSRMKSPLAQRMENLEQTIEGITNRLEELSHLLAHLNTSKKTITSRNLSASTNETKHSLDEDNQKWEEAALELEAMEKSFWRDKTFMK